MTFWPLTGRSQQTSRGVEGLQLTAGRSFVRGSGMSKVSDEQHDTLAGRQLN